MLSVYDKWPEIAIKSYELSHEIADFRDINHIVFCGMGGSGTISDLFSSILSKSNLHIDVVKGYHLPSTINENTLLVTVSVSGNTFKCATHFDTRN